MYVFVSFSAQYRSSGYKVIKPINLFNLNQSLNSLLLENVTKIKVALSTRKRYFRFSKKLLLFQKNCLKFRAMKMFKIVMVT